MKCKICSNGLNRGKIYCSNKCRGIDFIGRISYKRTTLQNKRNSEIQKQIKNHPSWFQKGHKTNIGRKHKLETIKKMQRSAIKTWNNQTTRRKRIEAYNKAMDKRNRPTSLEKEFIDIINKHNLPYKYTGDGKFWIGRKNPDFIDYKNKVCVEVANTIHHDENYPKERKKYFKKYGWNCFVFRTNHLNEKEVVTTLK